MSTHCHTQNNFTLYNTSMGGADLFGTPWRQPVCNCGEVRAAAPSAMAFLSRPISCPMDGDVRLRASDIPCVDRFGTNFSCGVFTHGPFVCPPVPLCEQECLRALVIAGAGTQNTPDTLSVPLALDPAVFGEPPYTIDYIAFDQDSVAVRNLIISQLAGAVRVTGEAVMLMTFTVSSATVSDVPLSIYVPVPLDVTIPIQTAPLDPFVFIRAVIASATATYDDEDDVLNIVFIGGTLNVMVVTGDVENIPISPLTLPPPICPYAVVSVLAPACECALPSDVYGPISVSLPQPVGTPPFSVSAVTFAGTQPGTVVTARSNNGLTVLSGSLILPMTVTLSDATGATETLAAVATVNITYESTCAMTGTVSLLARADVIVQSYTYDAAANALLMTLCFDGDAIIAPPLAQSVNMLTFTLPCDDLCGPLCCVTLGQV